MAARMKVLGVKGVVVDGRVRDLAELRSTQLQVSAKRRSLDFEISFLSFNFFYFFIFLLLEIHLHIFKATLIIKAYGRR